MERREVTIMDTYFKINIADSIEYFIEDTTFRGVVHRAIKRYVAETGKVGEFLPLQITYTENNGHETTLKTPIQAYFDVNVRFVDAVV